MQSDIIERETTKIKAIADLIIDAHSTSMGGGFSESQITGIAFILLDCADIIEDACFSKERGL
jgi:hypothetical protein